METTVAPSYTNISMDHIERKLIYPFIKMFSLICLRLIEETYFTRTSNKKDLMKFFNEFNTKHESIKFEYQISKTNIGFLDTKVYIENNKLYTKIYRKKTDRQTFLNVSSEHPKYLKSSIKYSQVLRIKRVYLKTTDFKYYLHKLKERFVKQGYNKNPIDQQFSKVKTIGRNEVLKDKTHDKETKNRTLLVLTYNHFLPNIRKHWNILNISGTLQGSIQEKPITAFKRNRNLIKI